jgi:hypothetical protein
MTAVYGSGTGTGARGDKFAKRVQCGRFLAVVGIADGVRAEVLVWKVCETLHPKRPW